MGFRVKVKVGAALEAVIERALEEGSYKDVVAAGKVLAILVGANAAHRIEQRLEHRLAAELPIDKASLAKILEDELAKLKQ